MKKIVQTTKTFLPLALLGIFVLGSVAYAATFTQPSSSPPSGNISQPISIGAEDGVKDGSLYVDTLTARQKAIALQELCVGDDCRNAWPDAGTEFSANCTINTLQVTADNDEPEVPHTNRGDVTKNELAQKCDGYLTTEEKNAGWMLLSFDNCPLVKGRDCAGPSYCRYIQLQCNTGITFERGTFERVAPYVPPRACEDGKDNDGDGFIDMDDMGCDSPSDDDETNDTNVLLR